MELLDLTNGAYRFLRGIAPYSAGVVAAPGHELVWVTYERPRPLREGIAGAAEDAAADGGGADSLCALALRSPQPMHLGEFADFNAQYRSLLAEFDIVRDDPNPIARTNVVAAIGSPPTASVYGFAYSRPAPDAAAPRTFVVSGAAELREQALDEDAVVRRGETSADALAEKAGHVLGAMTGRLEGLGVTWNDVTVVDVYTRHDFTGLVPRLLTPMGPAAVHGLRWYPSSPPVAGLEFEMDVRGVRAEYVRE